MGPFTAGARTSEELSVVCDEAAVPPGVRVEPGWRALRVRGLLPFDAVGILAALSTPLAEVGIPVFVVSTFGTDFLLVRSTDAGKAVAAVESCGHRVDPDPHSAAT